MTRFTVDLSGSGSAPDEPRPATSVQTVFGETPPIPGKRSRFRLILVLLGAAIVVFGLIGAIGGFLYWQSLKGTPQYSLALLVDAAKRDDKATIDTIVDVDAVVNDFIPQVTNKAVELYGKGLPPKIVGQLAQIAAPVLPAVKDRARAEIPRIIRERVDQFGSVPFAAMVIGAGRYLEIKVDGDNAIVKSKIPEHQLEIKMQRNGDRWKITGIKDDKLATEIAQKIGQDIIKIATTGGARKTADKLGVGSLTDLLKKAGDLIK